MCLGGILFFVTGVREVPPVGYRPEPTISFSHDTEDNGTVSRYPKANTCICFLKLSVGHSTFDSFTQAMEFAILNAEGFGFD
jgi:hypothetical protein